MNTPVDLTTTTSVVSISNISAPGAPAYSADVSFEVSNNAACVATVATVMSGTTSVFPVEWLSFTAKATSKDQVDLHWATASETNNEIFLIERTTDGQSFQVLGTLPGKVSSTERQDYYFTDDKLPVSPVVTYRIKQVDFDGQYSYSALRSVPLTNATKASIRWLAQQGQVLQSLHARRCTCYDRTV